MEEKRLVGNLVTVNTHFNNKKNIVCLAVNILGRRKGMIEGFFWV